MRTFVLYQAEPKKRPVPLEPIPFYINIHEYAVTEPHYHPFAELVYILDGSGFETISGITHRLFPGKVSLIPPHYLHETCSDTGQPIRKYCCTFDMNLLTESPFEPEWPKWIYEIGSAYPPFAVLDPHDNQEMMNIFEKMKQEYDQPPRPGQISMLQSRLTEALVLFRRAFDNPAETYTLQEKHVVDFFWPVVHYLHLHFTETITLKGVANHFHISDSYISRMFRAQMGASFLDYLHKLRIEHAVNLLTSTEMKVVDIAFEVGFDSFRTFSRVFKGLRGIVPTEFRRQYHLE